MRTATPTVLVATAPSCLPGRRRRPRFSSGSPGLDLFTIAAALVVTERRRLHWLVYVPTTVITVALAFDLARETT